MDEDQDEVRVEYHAGWLADVGTAMLPARAQATLAREQLQGREEAVARATYLDQRAENAAALAMLTHGFVPSVGDVLAQAERSARVQDHQDKQTLGQVEVLDARPTQRAKPLLSAPTAVRGRARRPGPSSSGPGLG